MTAAEGYRRLAALVEALEAAGVVVRGTRVGDDTDGRLPVELRVELPIEDAAEVAPWDEHSAGAPTESTADDPVTGRGSTEGTGAVDDGDPGRTDDAGASAGDSSAATSAAGTGFGATDRGRRATAAGSGTAPSEVGTDSGDRSYSEPGGRPVAGPGAGTDRPADSSAAPDTDDGSGPATPTDVGVGGASTEDGPGDDGDGGGEPGDDSVGEPGDDSVGEPGDDSVGESGDDSVGEPGDASDTDPDAGDDRTASDDADEEPETNAGTETDEEPETNAGTEADADTGDDDSVTACTYEGCTAVFATERGMKIHRTRVHGGDDDRPAHRDTDALREVYARYDTFAAMTEALGVDVTPQAVRQQMIRRGIHDPDSATDAGSTDEADATGEAGSTDETATADDGDRTDSPDPSPESGSTVDDATAADGATGGRSPGTDGDDDTAADEPPDGPNSDGTEPTTVEAQPDAERAGTADPADGHAESPDPAGSNAGSPESAAPRSEDGDVEGEPPASTVEHDAERRDGPTDGSAAGTDTDHEDADTGGEHGVDGQRPADPEPDAPRSTAETLEAAFEDLDGEGFGTDLGVDVDPRELAVAVEASSTLYEVQRELGLGSEETRDVLSAFDLLDLVMGRVATREDREERKVEIPERIRRSLADGAPS